VALLWLVLLAFGFWRDARWPEGSQRELSFAALALVSTYLVLVATLMLRRMHGWDRLTIVLALAFATTALIPFYLLAAQLWPLFFRAHQTTLVVGTCVILIGILTIAIVTLLTTPYTDYAREQRAEGVIEGHAAGVADEQAAQQVRDDAAHGE
jgi:hypothetical protein